MLQKLTGIWFCSGFHCNQCNTAFSFPFQRAAYYVGQTEQPQAVAETDLLDIPTEPVWCQHCNMLSKAELIAPLKIFEDAIALVRSKHEIEYPISASFEHYRQSPPSTAVIDQQIREYLATLATYVDWRHARQRRPRALCCGKDRYIPLADPKTLVMHEGCEYGRIVANPFHIGAWCGRRPELLDLRTYTPEGELIGLLTKPDPEWGRWKLEPLAYPPLDEDSEPRNLGVSWTWLRRHRVPNE